MRYSLVPLLLLMPALSMGQSAAVLADDGTPRVVANAVKTTRLSPDRVIVYAVIEGTAETAPEATQRADRKLQSVTEAVKQMGARAEIVTAVPYGIMPARNYDGFSGQSPQTPLVARYVVRVQPARLDQLMSVSSALMVAGATSITPPQFEATAADSARRAKFAEALAQARADAEALAAGVGMRLGALIEVSGNLGPTSSFAGPQYIQFSRGFDVSGPGQTPEVLVGASVTVRYRLQPR